MDGITIAVVALSCILHPDELDARTHVTWNRSFDFPIILDPDDRERADLIRLYASRDRGKSWKLEQEVPSTCLKFSLNKISDGVYWYSLQVIYKSGKSVPPTSKLEPIQKLFVNSERRIARTNEGWIIPPPLPGLENEAEKLRLFRETLAKCQANLALIEMHIAAKTEISEFLHLVGQPAQLRRNILELQEAIGILEAKQKTKKK